MKNFLTSIVLFFGVCHNTFAQEHPFTLSLQVGASNSSLSLAFEHKLSTNYNYPIHIHWGGWIQEKDTKVGISNAFLGAHSFRSINANNHFELGLTAAYSYGRTGFWRSGVSVMEEAVFIHPNIGLRHDHFTPGLFFKLLYSPLFPIVDLLNEEKIDQRFQEAGFPPDVKAYNDKDLPRAETVLLNFTFGVGYRF